MSVSVTLRGTRCALVLLAVIVLPLACGFHPRGSNVSPAGVGRLFVDIDRDLSIAAALREALGSRAFTLVSNRDEADILLRVSDERRTQQIVSVRSTGRVSEFELTHAVDMLISRPATSPDASDPGEEPTRRVGGAPPDAGVADRVVVTREYTYDESQVLGKENEARILRGEMSRELVRQVVLRAIASLARDGEPLRAGSPDQ